MVNEHHEPHVMAPVVSLSLVRQIKTLSADRSDICIIRYPTPQATVIKHGPAYPGRKGYLVQQGQIVESVPISYGSNTISQRITRTFKPGCLVFPQALDPVLGLEKSLTTYRAADKITTSIVELNLDLLSLLGITPEAVNLFIESEEARISEIIELLGSYEFDFQLQCERLGQEQDRTRALEQQLEALRRERDQLLKDNADLSTSFRDLEIQFEELAPPSRAEGMIFSSEELDAAVSEDVLTATLEDADFVEIISSNSDDGDGPESLQSAVAEDGDPQETTKEGVAPPSIHPPADDDEDSAPTRIPPPKPIEENLEGNRDTRDYIHVAPFVGLAEEEPPPPSEPESLAPATVEIARTPTIPLPSGIDEVAQLLQPQEILRTTLVPNDPFADDGRRHTLIDGVPAQSFFQTEIVVQPPPTQRRPLVSVRAGTLSGLRKKGP